ncbi:hypothetical protein BGX20_009594 [Mortierella sp. AD010]|nr:hypothetical protein BGX20_009594 [Mortierella sp. AD010]
MVGHAFHVTSLQHANFNTHPLNHSNTDTNTMERLQRMFQAGGHGMGPEPGQDNPTADNSEMVYISSLSLLKVTNAA